MASIKIGGRDLAVLPLNLRTLKVTLPLLNTLRAGGIEDIGAQVDAILDMALPALSRSNVGITRDWLEEQITVDRIPEILRVIAEASGLKASAPGEAQSP